MCTQLGVVVAVCSTVASLFVLLLVWTAWWAWRNWPPTILQTFHYRLWTAYKAKKGGLYFLWLELEAYFERRFFFYGFYTVRLFIQRGLQYFLLLETKIFGKQTRVTMITWRVCEGDELVQPFLSCSYIAVIYCTTCLRHLWTQHRNSARPGQPRNTNGLRRYGIHLSHNT